MAKKQKYYVVWQGGAPGIYDNWDDCRKQVVGHAAAQYKSFDTLAEAQSAFGQPYRDVVSQNTRSSQNAQNNQILFVDDNGLTAVKPGTENPLLLDALAVDAACSGNPGVMEYQGVYVATRTQVFHYRTDKGTNNIGEFLAIVHALALFHNQGNDHTAIYSDSRTALAWVRAKQCRTKLAHTDANARLFEIIARAERWLATHTWINALLKWDTGNWGEIPADFGRK